MFGMKASYVVEDDPLYKQLDQLGKEVSKTRKSKMATRKTGIPFWEIASEAKALIDAEQKEREAKKKGKDALSGLNKALQEAQAAAYQSMLSQQGTLYGYQGT